jgi:hypothetical protein
MFALIALMYFVAVHGLSLSGWLIAGAVFVDFGAWTMLKESIEAFSTGTRPDRIWEERQ